MEKSADVLLRFLTPRRPSPASNCSWVCRGPIVVEPIHEGGASNLRTGSGPAVERALSTPMPGDLYREGAE